MSRSATPRELLTAADVERLSFPNKQVELIRGRLVVREPPGTRHGVIAVRLAYFLQDFVLRRGGGVVAGQDTGFKISRDPDTVRAPDVAFVAAPRSELIPSRGYAELAPDIVAEVLSPDDTPAEVLAKVADWLGAGMQLVWVVDPERLEVRVHRGDGSLSVLGAKQSLDGEDVLPGFRCQVSQIFV
jgi:Uma2 family endonuclease